MKTVIHRSDTRGNANYGWLKTNYTFSFANYYNPERLNFGTLRVLNDDYIEGGSGFDQHHHDNMEIVTILLEGELKHTDSMGHTSVLKKNEIQTMSAGTGILHSEFNNLHDKPVKLLQIWIYPSKKNIKPSYNQKKFDFANALNKWLFFVSKTENGSLKINQNAYLAKVILNNGNTIDYNLHDKNNGVYFFVIEGNVMVNRIGLSRRDGLGIWETNEIELVASNDSEILAIEIPMS